MAVLMVINCLFFNGLTCIIPCLISTSNNLNSVIFEGTGVGTFV